MHTCFINSENFSVIIQYHFKNCLSFILVLLPPRSPIRHKLDLLTLSFMPLNLSFIFSTTSSLCFAFWIISSDLFSCSCFYHPYLILSLNLNNHLSFLISAFTFVLHKNSIWLFFNYVCLFSIITLTLYF